MKEFSSGFPRGRETGKRPGPPFSSLPAVKRPGKLAVSLKSGKGPGKTKLKKLWADGKVGKRSENCLT